MRRSVLTIPAFAKLNLSLDVLGLRPDGYHDIRSVVQTVSLADELSFAPADCLVVESPISPPEQDLVWRAARLLQQAAHVAHGAHITVRKEIPVGAGLGGGSADAAATLVGLNELWDLDRDRTELMDIGGQLGSDVPFLIQGGTALLEGRGERVTALSGVGTAFFVVLWPKFSLATDQVYRHAIAGSGQRSRTLLAQLSTKRWQLAGNDLTTAAVAVAPELGRWVSELSGRTGKEPQLTGSGSALFWLADSEPDARRLAEKVPDDAFVRVVQTVEEKPWNRANARADRGRDPGGH